MITVCGKCKSIIKTVFNGEKSVNIDTCFKCVNHWDSSFSSMMPVETKVNTEVVKMSKTLVYLKTRINGVETEHKPIPGQHKLPFMEEATESEGEQ